MAEKHKNPADGPYSLGTLEGFENFSFPKYLQKPDWIKLIMRLVNKISVQVFSCIYHLYLYHVISSFY